MDVLNEQQLHSVVVDPAITRINGETIPAAKAALNEEIVGAIYSLHQTGEALLNQARLSLEGIVKTGLGGLNDLLAKQDGWTLEITIPPITLRLTRPKPQ